MYTLTKTLAAASVAALALTGTAQAAQLSKAARTFLQNASGANMAEVEGAQLAEQKAQSPMVKQLAQTLLQDHQQLQQQLTTVEQQDGVQVKPNVTAADKSQMKKLQKMSGAQFDKRFVQDQIKDHKKDIKKFEDAAQKIDDPQVKQLAQQGLPVLQKHLGMAQQAQQQLQNGGKSAG